MISKRQYQDGKRNLHSRICNQEIGHLTRGIHPLQHIDWSRLFENLQPIDTQNHKSSHVRNCDLGDQFVQQRSWIVLHPSESGRLFVVSPPESCVFNNVRYVEILDLDLVYFAMRRRRILILLCIKVERSNSVDSAEEELHLIVLRPV